MAFSFFFRDLHTLEMVREHVVPLFRTRRHVHIWDAGCAAGQEPYTLAMLIRENVGPMIFRNIQICATDIDGSDLFAEAIALAEYPADQVKRIPEPYLGKYFVHAPERDVYTIVPEIVKRLSFEKHDLLTLEPIRQNLALIVCKNVLLHFSEAQRVGVLQMFHDALEAGGFLVLEQTQKLPSPLSARFRAVVASAQVFQKV